QPAFGQDAGYQTGGGRLAVRTGYGYALLQAHELGQHHRARHHWNLALARGHHFGVVRLHGSGSDDRVGADHMTGRVAQVGLDSQTFQASQRGAVREIRTRDQVAQVAKHFGNARHAGAADANKVNVLDGVFHGLASSSHALTISAVALIFCMLLAARARRINSGRCVSRIRPASHCGLRSRCCTSQPPPASTRNLALVVWWSSTADGKGTNTAAAPTAAISVTVLAPARHTIRSASAKARAVSSMNGVSSAWTPAAA